ncbi:MAG: DUF359 domain-containing protein [Thermoplasmata archaeon]
MQLKQGERLKLPFEYREELSRPVGKVYSEEEILKEIKNEEKIITVGDETTITLLKHDVRPLLSIFDLKSQRIKIGDEILKNFKSRIIVKNPPGYITYDLYRAIKYALENKIEAIQVVGEEDLASLVCISLADDGVTIIYGIPNMGLGLIRAESEIRLRVEKIFEKMVMEYGS